MCKGRAEEISCENEGQEWDYNVAVQNQIAMSLPVFLGAAALIKRRPVKLLPYLLFVAFFSTLWRKAVCARCQYYGKACSTLLGVFTSKIMRKDERKELNRNTMLIDFSIIGLLALFPLREAMNLRVIRVLYPASLLAGFLFIFLKGCPRCGNDFCPLKVLYNSLPGGRKCGD